MLTSPAINSRTLSLLSSLAGLGFPLFGWYTEIHYHQLPLTLSSITLLHRDMVVIWLLDSAPLVMGMYGFLLGHALERLRIRLHDQAQSEQKIRLLLNNLASGVVMINHSGIIQACNRTACEMFGYSEPELLGQNVKILMPPETAEKHDSYLDRYLQTGRATIIGQRTAVNALKRDGQSFPIEVMVGEMSVGEDRFFVGSIMDMSERKLLEAQLHQAQRLESIGQLAAGIAHEINTPIQYVGDNLHALQQNFDDLIALLAEYRNGLQGASEDCVTALKKAETRYDLEYILDDTPKAIRQSIEGTERVSHIIKAMKDFSHIDRAKISVVDINAALLNTLTIARNEYKYVADVATEFGPLPQVECYASDLNQVFLNLIVNAAHAIADKGDQRGTIRVSTVAVDGEIEIRIADSGAGIPPAIRERVFDPFFTTKEVGKGTGQGLSIAHQVVRKHGGRIWFESEVDEGTTFYVRIPATLPPESRTHG